MTTASGARSARSASRRITLGWAPAARTRAASRVDQIRSSARIATDRTPVEVGVGSAKARGEVPEHVARRYDAGGLAAVDDRHVAEAADSHLVDRDGDRVAPPQD